MQVGRGVDLTDDMPAPERASGHDELLMFRAEEKAVEGQRAEANQKFRSGA